MAAGFLIVLAGIVLMVSGSVTQGVATAASAVIVGFIQRIFTQREKYYHSLAAKKNSHLEYGNQWLLIIQSIDSIKDPEEKAKRQVKLTEVLLEKLVSWRSE